jgi:hypothetical protein
MNMNALASADTHGLVQAHEPAHQQQQQQQHQQQYAQQQQAQQQQKQQHTHAASAQTASTNDITVLPELTRSFFSPL